jgi:hypothetical protein
MVSKTKFPTFAKTYDQHGKSTACPRLSYDLNFLVWYGRQDKRKGYVYQECSRQIVRERRANHRTGGTMQ